MRMSKIMRLRKTEKMRKRNNTALHGEAESGSRDGQQEDGLDGVEDGEVMIGTKSMGDEAA